jgi:hypothetical protein
MKYPIRHSGSTLESALDGKNWKIFLISEFESSGEVHEKAHVFSIIDMRNVIYRSTAHTGAKR